MSPKTIAMIFPGQGSQASGMGRALAETYPAARAVFERADAVLKQSISELCFSGADDELRKTCNTQPALYIVSAAAFAVLRERGIEPAIVAGHSLGEYSALHAAGSLDFETGLRLVAQRGQAMWEVGNARPGSMAALLSLDADTVKKICDEASADGICVPANWNSAEQVVISGEPAAVERAIALAKAAGSRRSMLLPVSGAFHSPLVLPAAHAMEKHLADATISPPRCKFVANVTGKLTSDPEAIRKGLVDQIANCVLWADCVETIKHEKPDCAIEVGSGKVLAGLLRRIAPDIKALSFGQPDQLSAIEEALA